MRYGLKLMISILLLMAVSLGIGGTMLIQTSFAASLEKQTQAALESYESLRNTLYLLNSMAKTRDFREIQSVLDHMASRNMGGWQALCLKTDSEIIYQSGVLSSAELTLPQAEEGQCCYESIADSRGHGLLVTSILSAGNTKLSLLARYDLSSVYESRETQLRLYGGTYLVMVLFGAVFAFILSSTLTVRLRRLTGVVRRIAGGDLSKRSRLTTQDEFGQLSRDFDAMADKLQQNISSLESEMERQESFMGAFAHELKTPMTSIIGFADLLRQDGLDENTRMMAANYIFAEGQRLERLSFKLLELLLLKKDAVVMKKVWLANFLSDVERALSPGLKQKGIRLVCRAEQRRVALEPDLVKSLLYNLIDNAAKAMDGEGIIAVSATGIMGGIRIQVVDTGRGMEQAELSRITEAFYRVDKARSRSQGGAGLGLALCKQIVELHNGNIRFQSILGKGSRVTVELYGKAGKENGKA